MASIGRGRGRARNLTKAVEGNIRKVGETPSSQSPTPKAEDVSLSEFEKTLESSLKNNSTANKNELLQQAQSLGKDEEIISKLVHLLGEKCLEDLDLATNSGEVVCCLIEAPNLGTSFRTILLKRVQYFYKDRHEMRKMKIERYFGFATLLCSLFKWMRVNDEPLKALVVPIYGLLEELLNGQTNCPEEKEARENRTREIETFHNCLLMVASLLEVSDEVRFI